MIHSEIIIKCYPNVIFKPSGFLLVNTENMCGKIFHFQVKFPISWIPIEMTGFHLWKLTEQQ